MADTTKATYSQLAQHLNRDSTNQVFAIQGTTQLVATEGRDRAVEHASLIEGPASEDSAHIAHERGFNDIRELATLKKEDFNKQLGQLSSFVESQAEIGDKAWGAGRAKTFVARADALLEGASSEKFRTSAQATVGDQKTKGWDENIQTEVVASRIQGRQKALEALATDGTVDAERTEGLHTMHRLLAISSSLARTPTAVVAGSYNAFGDASASNATLPPPDDEASAGFFGASAFATGGAGGFAGMPFGGAPAAHPAPRAVSKHSDIGTSVGASPRAHMLRTGIMQAFEEDLRTDGASVVERQMGRVLIAKRATTNAFEAPTIDGVTNSVFAGSKRPGFMEPGREIDKGIYDDHRKAARALTIDTTLAATIDSTAPSSPGRGGAF
jgi:hypothetical protein